MRARPRLTDILKVAEGPEWVCAWLKQLAEASPVVWPCWHTAVPDLCREALPSAEPRSHSAAEQMGEVSYIFHAANVGEGNQKTSEPAFISEESKITVWYLSLLLLCLFRLFCSGYSTFLNGEPNWCLSSFFSHCSVCPICFHWCQISLLGPAHSLWQVIARTELMPNTTAYHRRPSSVRNEMFGAPVPVCTSVLHVGRAQLQQLCFLCCAFLHCSSHPQTPTLWMACLS